jgi:hypothetical protein
MDAGDERAAVSEQGVVRGEQEAKVSTRMSREIEKFKFFPVFMEFSSTYNRFTWSALVILSEYSPTLPGSLFQTF